MCTVYSVLLATPTGRGVPCRSAWDVVGLVAVPRKKIVSGGCSALLLWYIMDTSNSRMDTCTPPKKSMYHSPTTGRIAHWQTNSHTVLCAFFYPFLPLSGPTEAISIEPDNSSYCTAVLQFADYAAGELNKKK